MAHKYGKEEGRAALHSFLLWGAVGWVLQGAVQAACPHPALRQS